MNKRIALDAEGITICGELYLPCRQAPHPTVCVCHGIPSRAPDPADRGYPALAERLCREGFAVMIFNFRGTGESGGNFDLLGWPRDLKAVIDYLWRLDEVDKSHLSLLGYSAGAAVSIVVAAQDERISCVAACACPADFGFVAEAGEPEAVVGHFRSLGLIRDECFPPSAEEWLNGFRLIRAIDHVAAISPRPLLLVHSRQDETVEVSHAHRLYAQAREPKELVILDGAEHALRRDKRATDIIIGWLRSQCH